MSSLEIRQVHELKTLPPFFEHVVALLKTFEVRKNDRFPPFMAGDILDLREFDGQNYTGRRVCKRVAYILSGGAFGVEPGYVVMGLGHIEDWADGDYSGDALPEIAFPASVCSHGFFVGNGWECTSCLSETSAAQNSEKQS